MLGHDGRRRPPTLYQQLYLHALFVVVASISLCFALVWTFRPHHFAERFARVGESLGAILADRLSPDLGDPRKLAGDLDGLAHSFDGRLAVYDPSGQLLAQAGPALPAPGPEQLGRARERGFASGFAGTRGHFVLVPIRRGGAIAGYLEGALSHRDEPRSGWRLAGMFALVLLLVAALMVPATRNVTRPLERLTESARRFGRGEFGHRAPVRGEDEIGKLAAAMNEMAERLSAMIHTQRELLANVSHELRSPLARIQVALELARERGASSGPLDEIARDAAELAHLVDDCLAASRLELRPDSVRRTTFPPEELVFGAADRLVAGGFEPSRLRREVAPDLPEVDADRELCAHALQNLLDNARKHTPPGTSVAVGALREGNRVRLFVRDAGPGLPPEELPRIFEPFYRPDVSRSREGDGDGGAGLGLSLVRRIAELHGDEPSVESTPGAGATFSFTLPTA